MEMNGIPAVCILKIVSRINIKTEIISISNTRRYQNWGVIKNGTA
jgi:hypothetical protein